MLKGGSMSSIVCTCICMVDVILLKTGNMIVPDFIFKLFVDDDRCFQLVPNSTFTPVQWAILYLLNDYARMAILTL